MSTGDNERLTCDNCSLLKVFWNFEGLEFLQES